MENGIEVEECSRIFYGSPTKFVHLQSPVHKQKGVPKFPAAKVRKDE
jgi:hypothetical protein